MRTTTTTIYPLIKKGEYGPGVDVTALVNYDGLSKIKKAIDSTDYSVGIFRFNDLRARGQNGSGKFNENDSRSIFTFGRNKAKVEIETIDVDPETLETESTIKFEGLLNEEATRLNITNDEISFLVLSKDSVLRTTQVPVATIPDGTSAKTAITSILSQTDITDVLTIDTNDINPDLNFTIDDGSKFDNESVTDSLNLLLLASNSVLILDLDGNVTVKSRGESAKILNLRGRGSLTGDSNVISISSYNSGRQRQFNSVILNSSLTVQDDDHIFEYGLKQQKFDFDFITDIETLRSIGQRFVDEFKFPKIELKLRVPTPVVNGYDLLDSVKLDMPWLRKRKRSKVWSSPFGGAMLGLAVLGVTELGESPPAPELITQDDFFPVSGVTVLGDTQAPLPLVQGSVQILSNLKFKIISVEEDNKSFITTLKIRQTGTSSNDGVYDESTFSILGSAILGSSILGRG